ncbi:MAG: histidine kinase [Terrimicrobiaceae bacterium]
MPADMARYVVRLLVLAIGVYLITRGLAWVQGGANFISPIWPACGIALAGMLVWGVGMWPAIYLPMCLSSLGAGDAVAFSLLAPAGLMGVLWATCWGLERMNIDRRLSTTRDVVVLVVAGAVMPMAVAGLWNAAMLVLTGMMAHVSLIQTALVYGIANATGVVVVAPLVLLAAAGRHPSRRWQEWVILGALLFSVWVAFSAPGHQTVLAYLPFPFLVWLALTGGLPMAALGILGAVAGAVAFSSHGAGPFAGGAPLANFAQIELYIGIFATTGLLIGAGAEAQRREKALRAEAATREAEMERIKAQIHPHFLFNCLAAIHSLVGTDTEGARGGILALSDLLRASLDAAGEKFVPLVRETKLIENYLALQRMRFEDALEATMDCSPAASAIPVPPMLIQPLVENAIKHGVDDDGQVSVEVLAYEKPEGLCILVKNTLPASAPRAEEWSDGVGLASVKRRVEEAWGGRATLTFSREDPNWLVATILIMKGGA